MECENLLGKYPAIDQLMIQSAPAITVESRARLRRTWRTYAVWIAMSTYPYILCLIIRI
ncbi:hypothetical protein LZ32DRAFT_603999 [Colletotrichum eremochloae]|nr:hypothetical protein LZ32DRAFT_603999 [Colletotrichum eremochloae]